MSANRTLDDRIRSLVVELVEAAPPPPELDLHRVTADRPPRPIAGAARIRTVHRALWLSIGVSVLAVVSLVATLLLGPNESPRQVSEASLGMQLVNYSGAGGPSSGTVPAGFTGVASGTFFGHPWIVSGMRGRRLCVGFTYAGTSLGGTCGPSRDLGVSAKAPHQPERPWWARSRYALFLGTARDGQRFLAVATDATVSAVTVRSARDTYVIAPPLPWRLGTASFFVLSLGREQGPCDGLCQGSVTVSFTTPAGPALVDGKPALVAHDYGGVAGVLSAPLRS